MLDVEEAKSLLLRQNIQKNVFEHCLTVSLYSVEVAEKIRAQGHEVDVGFVEVGGLIHDIGRARTQGILHGVEGAKILAKHPRLARVCECHIGGGITKDDAEKLGLPPKDYLPHTLEEKIICYADKLVEGNKRITIDDAIQKFEQRLGKDHPTIDRIRELDAEMKTLMNN